MGCTSSTGSSGGNGGSSSGNSNPSWSNGNVSALSTSDIQKTGEKLGVDFKNERNENIKDEVSRIAGVEKVTNGRLSMNDINTKAGLSEDRGNGKEEFNSKMSNNISHYEWMGYTNKGTFSYNGVNGHTVSTVMERNGKVALISLYKSGHAV